MSFFVSCNSDACPRKDSCGRYTHYTDKNYVSDFFGKGVCVKGKEDYDNYVMQLSAREVQENTMAKAKDGSAKPVKTRKARK